PHVARRKTVRIRDATRGRGAAHETRQLAAFDEVEAIRKAHSVREVELLVGLSERHHELHAARGGPELSTGVLPAQKATSRLFDDAGAHLGEPVVPSGRNA